MSEYIGNRIVPRHDGVWDKAKEYEPLTIVYEESTGDSYMSRKPVPAGTLLSQEEYWAMCSRFSEQMALYRQNTAEEVEQFRKDTAADVEQLRTDTAADVATLRKMTAQDIADITQKVDAANSAVAASKSEMDKTAETLKAQINANVKASTDKNANYAQELVDARVDDLYNRTRSGKKPRAFSQRLICGECGRFFHVTNGNGNYPIWRCPTSSRTTGKRICHAEKVYEEQVVRAFRKAVLERFRLTFKPIHDNVAVADIMSGRFKEQYDNFTPEADSFVSQMLARLESIQKLDFMERDRAFYKKQIAAAHTSVESTSKKIRLLKSQVDVMQTRLELLGDEMIDPASIEEKKKLIEKLERDIQKDMDTEQKLTEQLDYMEDYWEELEGDYERREKAIEWMKNLPAGRDGMVAFLNEVTEEHCKAFLLSITIHSPLKFTVHWFDDTKTEVEMDSNIEDYRNTASYYDGHTMRDGSQRKRHVR